MATRESGKSLDEIAGEIMDRMYCEEIKQRIFAGEHDPRNFLRSMRAQKRQAAAQDFNARGRRERGFPRRQ